MSCLVQCRKELGRIADLLSAGEYRQAPSIVPHASINEIRDIFAAQSSACARLYVVDEQGVFMGIVCLEDILRYSLFYNHDPYSPDASQAQLSLAETAAGFMRQTVFANPADDLVDTLEKMMAEGLQEIVVVDDKGRLTALVALVDLRRYDIDRNKGVLGTSEA